jgi:hypothetical protein
LTTKRELVKQCAEILARPNVTKWYKENLEGKPQGDILKQLESAIYHTQLSSEEIIAIALIIGLQYSEKF